MTLPRVAIVGDVHGNTGALVELLDEIPHWNRPVVFVGDYVDHGPNARGVLDLLASLDLPDLTFLEGNHDAALKAYLEGAPFGAYAGAGGLATLASYIPNPAPDVRAALRTAMPPAHRRFLHALRTHWERDSLLVSHMGFDPRTPTSRTRDAMVLQPHGELFHGDPRCLAKASLSLTVCGHYQPFPSLPRVSDHVICVDTGSGHGGPLTVVLLPERQFVSFGGVE